MHSLRRALPVCVRGVQSAAAPLSAAPVAALPAARSAASLLSSCSSFTPRRALHFTRAVCDESATDADATPAEPEKRDQEEIAAFLTKLKLGDHAEKFRSFDHLLNARSLELKQMGLNVKQRKTLLKLLDRYKVSLRVRRANAMIHALAHEVSPEELQSRVYRVMFGHIYRELDWRDANREIEQSWLGRVNARKDERRWEHNDLRGLREPEVQEMMKVEARMMQHEIKRMQQEAKEAEEEQRKFEAEEKARLEAEAAAAAEAEAAAQEERRAQADKINAVSDEEVADQPAAAASAAATEQPIVDATATPQKTE